MLAIVKCHCVYILCSSFDHDDCFRCINNDILVHLQRCLLRVVQTSENAEDIFGPPGSDSHSNELKTHWQQVLSLLVVSSSSNYESSLVFHQISALSYNPN